MNKNYILYSLLLLCLTMCMSLQAQGNLTLEDVKVITLENNFGIKIAKNDLSIAKNLTDKKINNYLPTLSASGGLNGSFGGSTQQFNNGSEASTANAFTWGANASIAATYTLYDKGRALTLEQLNESLILSDLQLRQTIEQNLLQVYNSYYLIAQFNENLNALEEAINITSERLRRAEYNLELGQGSGLEVLNAKVDIKRDSVNLINVIMNLNNEKRNLNVAMGRSASIEYQIAANAILTDDLNIESLMESSKANNINLQVIQQNLNVGEKNLKIIDAEKIPSLNTGASYDYNFQDNPSAAFINKSNSRGFSGNIGVNWTLFDGSRDLRKQNAIINLNNQQLQLDQLQKEIDRDILNAWSNYENAIYIIRVEESALETNEENFTRTEEQFKFGQVSSIEFRQAQLNLLNSQTSLNNARYDAKIRELQLLQLTGKLIN